MIKGKPGNLTPGSTKETLDAISMKYFTRLSEELIQGKFNFTPTRRIMIPKGPGKTGERPLSIASPREKIVQKALALILETIYEPLFSDNSHGFRPNRGVHTALKQIHLKGGNFTWVINGDISKCFDSIPHKIIMKLLSQQISCHRTLELINKSLINPAILGKKVIPSHQGTPQGSIVSPILSNIVLHEFDIFCDKLKDTFEIGTKRRRNPKYHSLSNSRSKSSNPLLRADHLQKMMEINATDPQDPNFRRFMYVRYADDFVILTISSQTDAFTIKRKITDFLKNHLGLDLSIEKTTIANVKEGFNFLGAHIEKRDKVIVPVNINQGGEDRLKGRQRRTRR